MSGEVPCKFCVSRQQRIEYDLTHQPTPVEKHIIKQESEIFVTPKESEDRWVLIMRMLYSPIYPLKPWNLSLKPRSHSWIFILNIELGTKALRLSKSICCLRESFIRLGFFASKITYCQFLRVLNIWQLKTGVKTNETVNQIETVKIIWCFWETRKTKSALERINPSN